MTAEEVETNPPEKMVTRERKPKPPKEKPPETPREKKPKTAPHPPYFEVCSCY